MKEKIKKSLFVISIFYSTVIILLMFSTLKGMITKVELHDTDENRNILINYKKELEKFDKNQCVETINKIIKHYEDTSYDGEVNLKEMYEYDLENGIISYYSEVKDNCKISEEELNKYNLPTKFITVSIQRDEIYQQYYFQYELNLKDKPARMLSETGLLGIEYKINRDTELEIISSLIEIISKEDFANE